MSAELMLEASRLPDGRASIVASLGGRVVARDTVDLSLAEDRRRCADLIREVVPALDLVAIRRELMLIDPETLPPAAPGPDDPWPDPVPIGRPAVPPFPADLLPEPLRAWVRATAEATQTPADLSGLLSLAVCAGAVARRVEIVAGRGWREPINLYVAVLLDPGNRKSAVFKSALAPLRRVELELIEAAGPEVAREASDRRMLEAEQKVSEQKAAKGDGEARERARELAEELAAVPAPVLPRLILDDATPEAVEMALAAQGGRLVVAGAEGGVFDVMGGRYSSGVGNLDPFLKGHAGDELRVDRVGRGSIAIDRPALTAAYAIQPDVIRGLGAKPSFRGRGLIGRFLYATPESPLGKRRIDPEPVPDAVSAAYGDAVRRLAAIEEPGDGAPWILSLGDEARERFLSWQSEVEPMLGPTGELGTMTDWAGKLAGLTARLAAVLHLVAQDDPEPWRVSVGIESIESAVGLARWAIPHAEAAIDLVAGEVEGPVADAGYVLLWLRDRGKPEVSRREIGQHGRRRFDGQPERLSAALGVLIDRGWIRPIEDGPRGPGRPSERWRVHPEVTGGSSAPDPRPADPPWEAADVAPAKNGRVKGVI